MSLRCVCCKLLEHIITTNLFKHLEKHNILTPFQHGFRPNRSCETQLLITLQDLLQQYDKDRKSQIDIAVLDFSKAFDKVPHKRLLAKLTSYGASPQIISWIKDFLLGRTQRVTLEGNFSSWLTVDSGVPQGSVLGPLLFLCFINDLPLAVKSQVRLFADDCLLYRTIKTATDQLQLQKDLASLTQWAETWGMLFNASKCYILRISRTKTPRETLYSINGQVLKQVTDTAYLGVTLSEHLKWTTHIDSLCRKSNSTLGFLRRNLRFCPEKLKSLAYTALV